MRLYMLGFASLLALTYAVQPPPAPLSRTTYSFAEPFAPAALAGDSLKVYIFWTQTPDSAQFGKIDSTVYALRSSKPALFFGGTVLAANTDIRRVKNATAFADSFKLARPAPGDSATFQVKAFMQCRKGDCSTPGGAGFAYRSTFAPPATMPSGTKVVIF